MIPAEGSTEESSDQRSSNAEKHGNDDAAGIFPGHNELGDCPDNEADDEHPKEMHRFDRLM